MHAVQQALAGSTFTDVIGVPAWKIAAVLVPGRYAGPGHPTRRRAAVRQPHGARPPSRSPSSHIAMVSHPAQVTQLITAAAETCAATAAMTGVLASAIPDPPCLLCLACRRSTAMPVIDVYATAGMVRGVARVAGKGGRNSRTVGGGNWCGL